MSPQVITNRRQVLKSVGMGTLAAASFTSTVSARTDAPYVGFAYNPVTGEIYGDVEGKLNPGKATIAGELKFTGDKALDRLRLVSKQVPFSEAKLVNESMPNEETIEKMPDPGAVTPVRRFRTDVPNDRFKSRTQTDNQIPHMKINSIQDGGLTGYIRTHEGEKVAYSLNEKGTDIEYLLDLICGLGGDSDE